MAAAIWKSDEVVKEWAAKANERERARIGHWQTMAKLLPFGKSDEFTFLDLGAGMGAAARNVLDYYPRSTAVLAEFSPQMISEGTRQLAPYGDRFRYVEFDMLAGAWPDAIPTHLDAVITSLCIHHMPHDRKQGLFVEIRDHLVPGGWYFNYDPVTSSDPLVERTWQHTNERDDPEAERKRTHRTAQEKARYENHVRYMIPLDQQLRYLGAAGFEGIDVYWKHLENVIYGGRRPS